MSAPRPTTTPSAAPGPTGSRPSRRRLAGPHLLRTAESAPGLAALWQALGERGMRFGWLDLASPVAAAGDELADIAAAGALRAVGLSSNGSVVRKARRGPPDLADLLREHFTGCSVVFLRAAENTDAALQSPRLAEAARLTRLEDGRFRLDAESGVHEMSAAELADRLRSPR
jgi:hypothetical protein